LAEEQAKKGAMTAEERDLQQALRLSEEEEAKRRSAVDDSNASALFDDHNQLESPTNNPFPFIDPTPYATGLQPQFTQVQPQFTSFNPYQQQAQQEAMQAEYFANSRNGCDSSKRYKPPRRRLSSRLNRRNGCVSSRCFRFQQQQQQQQQQQPIPCLNPLASAPTIHLHLHLQSRLCHPSPHSQVTHPRAAILFTLFQPQGTYANSSAPTFSSTI
jgi:epsin